MGSLRSFLQNVLAACDLAPMMLVDEKVVGPVHESDLDRILEEARKGEHGLTECAS